MMDILIWALILWIGFLLGFLTKGWFVSRFSDYSGTIVVRDDEVLDKRVYSLVLDDYPEKLEFKKVVKFKVDSSEKRSDRE